MKTKKTINLLGREISRTDIKKIKSPALKKILTQQFENCNYDYKEKCIHGRYTVYSRYRESHCVCLPLMGL